MAPKDQDTSFDTNYNTNYDTDTDSDEELPAMEIILTPGRDYIDEFFRFVNGILWGVCGSEYCGKLIPRAEIEEDWSGRISGFTCEHCNSITTFTPGLPWNQVE